MAQSKSKSKAARPADRNVVQVIRDHYPNLNDTFRRIADFVLLNLEKATYSSLLEISRDIGVSDATLIRFARALGFRGFRDFRESLIKHIRKIIYPIQKPGLLPGDGRESYLTLVRDKDVEYIKKTMNSLDLGDFEALVNLVRTSRRIYCLGWGCSSFLAEYLAHSLVLLSFDAVAVVRERRPLVQQLLLAGDDDLLVVFDIILYSTEVLEAVEYVRREKKTKIVTFTNDAQAQIVQYADLSFFIDVSGHDFKLISLTAPFCLINALDERLVVLEPERTGGALNKFERVVQVSPLHYLQFDPQNFQWRTGRREELAAKGLSSTKVGEGRS
ncbi:MAG: MurR/RpiR family transcriptional regulator [Thermodesulfobacteriota bacterium]